MPFKLLKVREDAEFDELMSVWRTSFTKPLCKLWPLFTGDRTPLSISPNESMRLEYTNRFIAWHRSDPTSTWLKVIDEDTQKVVGGGRWSIYEGNPYDVEGCHKVEAVWWPEGGERAVASGLLARFLESAVVNMNRPHVCKLFSSLQVFITVLCTAIYDDDVPRSFNSSVLNILFTHPEYRGKGVASLVMKWGLEHADERGMESYIEATDLGKPVYEKFGFKVIDTRELRLGKEEVEYQGVEEELLPFKWWSMYRGAV